MSIRPEFLSPTHYKIIDFPDSDVENDDKRSKNDNSFIESDYHIPSKSSQTKSIDLLEDDSSCKSIESLSIKDFFSFEMGTKFLKDINGISVTTSLKENIPQINVIISKTIPEIVIMNHHYDKDFLSTKEIYKTNWQTHEFNNLVFNKNLSNHKFYNHLKNTYEGLKNTDERIKYAKSLYDELHCLEIRRRKHVNLVRYNNKKILFFELDQTLLSTSFEAKKSSDYKMNYYDSNGSFKKVYIKLRPYCMESLKILSRYYNIYIFTNKTKQYSQNIIDILDPEMKIFGGCLSHSLCFKIHKGNFIKDLRIIGNEKLENMILIDHSSQSFLFQIDNGISILPWNDEVNDCELKYLTDYLIQLRIFPDLRERNKQFFKLGELARIKDLKTNEF